MNVNKQYTYLYLLYAVTLAYIILDNNPVITIILVLFLMAYHIFTINGMFEKLNIDKETSVTKLQHKLDETMKESEEIELNFLSLTQTIGSGVIVVNDDGVIDFSNKDITEFFEKNLNGLSYEEITDVPPLYKFVTQAYLGENSLREQIIYRNSFYDLISTPIFENSFFKGCIIVAHDVTALRTAENFQKRFTADVSHELKTPLASIKGMSEILGRDENMEAKDRIEFIDLIQKESIRMETILKDLLVISKMDRLDYELKIQEAKIHDLLNGSISSLQRLADDKGIEIKTDIKKQTMFFDPTKLEHVFLNLIKNAINYTDSGRITIKGKTTDKHYVVTVKDTGIGIEKDQIENIFKRFFRVDGARSRDTGGSGLGLSISKNVVLKHGGTIAVKSELGKGSKFTVRLPIKN